MIVAELLPKMYIPNLVKYSTFAASTFQALDYFTQYSNSSAATTQLPNFGLSSEWTWNSFLSNLTALNAESNDAKYKLIFLARHGQGWHNVLDSRLDWVVISTQDTYENYTLLDADLTSEGETQVKAVHDYWKKELALGAPYPETFYSSPLRRTLHTYNLTWQNDSIVPIVDENLRELYGIQTPQKRHNKTWIELYCPTCIFVDGFTEEDELWKSYALETISHIKERAENWLKLAFESDEQVVSVTSHSVFIYYLLKVIGHPSFSLDTAELIPVVVKATA